MLQCNRLLRQTFPDTTISKDNLQVLENTFAKSFPAKEYSLNDRLPCMLPYELELTGSNVHVSTQLWSSQNNEGVITPFSTFLCKLGGTSQSRRKSYSLLYRTSPLRA
jgi:hypothetical protein